MSSSISRTASSSGSDPWITSNAWCRSELSTKTFTVRPRTTSTTSAANAPHNILRMETTIRAEPCGLCKNQASPCTKRRRRGRNHRQILHFCLALNGTADATFFGRGGVMALRPLRNAMISFGLVSIPVRFYTATKSEDVHFNLLHKSCGTRVNRKWWCPHHEKIVDSDELIRGYAISKNKYVTFTDEEIETLETDDDRALEITEFVDLHEIDPVFYEKAYFLGPSPGGGKTYRLL